VYFLVEMEVDDPLWKKLSADGPRLDTEKIASGLSGGSVEAEHPI
jgi:hypothetical protein